MTIERMTIQRLREETLLRCVVWPAWQIWLEWQWATVVAMTLSLLTDHLSLIISIWKFLVFFFHWLTRNNSMKIETFKPNFSHPVIVSQSVLGKSKFSYEKLQNLWKTIAIFQCPVNALCHMNSQNRFFFFFIFYSHTFDFLFFAHLLNL